MPSVSALLLVSLSQFQFVSTMSSVHSKLETGGADDSIVTLQTICVESFFAAFELMGVIAILDYFMKTESIYHAHKAVRGIINHLLGDMESWFPKLEEKDKDKEKQAERVRGIGTIIEGVLGIFASLSGFIIKLLGFSIFFVTFRVTLDAWLSFFLYPPFLVFQFAKDFTVFFAGASVGIVAVYAALSPDSFAVFLFGLRYTLDVSGVVGMTLLLWKLGNSVNDYGVIGASRDSSQRVKQPPPLGRVRASSIRLQGPFKPDVELEVVRKTVPDSSLEEESDDELDTKEQSRSLGVEELSPASPVSSINSDSSENQDDEINLIPARQEKQDGIGNKLYDNAGKAGKRSLGAIKRAKGKWIGGSTKKKDESPK